MAGAAQREWVQRVLDVPMEATAQPSGADSGTGGGATNGAVPKGQVIRLAQAMIVWNNTRTYVAQQVKQLQDTILEATSTQPNFDEIKANISNLEAVLEGLDDNLTVKLNQLRDNYENEAKDKISQEARGLVAKMQKFAAEDQLMNDIDNNGFVTLDIKARVTASLDEVMKTI